MLVGREPLDFSDFYQSSWAAILPAGAFGERDSALWQRKTSWPKRSPGKLESRGAG